MDYKGKWALITGASAGIGHAYAHELAARGTNLILVARRQEKLSALANELIERHKIEADVIPANLASVEAAQQVFNEVEQRKRTVNILINNAGMGVYGNLGETDLTKNEELILLNVFSPAIITQLFLPKMVQNKEGFIINIASTAAFQPLPYMANYGASKAYILSFSEALWAEYRDKGIKVLAVCPGPVETDFFQAMGTDEPAIGKRDTPEHVVKTSLKALEENKSYVIPILNNYWLAQSSRFATRKFVAIASEKMLRPKHKN